MMNQYGKRTQKRKNDVRMPKYYKIFPFTIFLLFDILSQGKSNNHLPPYPINGVVRTQKLLEPLASDKVHLQATFLPSAPYFILSIFAHPTEWYLFSSPQGLALLGL